MPRTSVVEPSGCPAVRVICCDALGFVKVVEARPKKEDETASLELVARWGQPAPSHRIVAMSYSAVGLAVARNSGMVEILNHKNGSICCQITSTKRSVSDEGDTVRGLHLFDDDSYWGRAVVICKENGDAAIHQFKEQPVDSSSLSATDTSEIIARWQVCNSGSILCMKVHKSEKFAAFGGKGVEFNLWDLEQQQRVWEAKKPRRDKLGLIAPSWYTAAAFLHKDDHRKVAVGTADHQIRLYDVVAQRRSVLAFEYGDTAIKSIAEDGDGHTVYVGTAAGNLVSFDMRTGKLVGAFKGKMAGSVRCIARHPSQPLIASCGLDRFLRIHSITTRQIMSKIFLKQQLVGVAFDEDMEKVDESANSKRKTSKSSDRSRKKICAAT